MPETGWTKPCNSHTCLEARRSGAYVEVRNSEHPVPTIWVPTAGWEDLKEAITAGQLPEGVHVAPSGEVHLLRVVAIAFTGEEWDAFTAAVKAGTFHLDGEYADD